MIKVIILTIILFSIHFGQSRDLTDSLLLLIKNSTPSKAVEIEERFLLMMYSASYDSAKALSEKLLRLSPGINNNSLYMKTLIHSYRFHNFEESIRMLTRAQSIADETNNSYLLASAYLIKAIVFRNNSMTDSAMTCALTAKDILESLRPKHRLGSALQLIADLHYYAGEYEEAERTYRNIIEEEAKDTSLWPNITINNNIGLIRIKQGRYDEAENIFRRSLQRLESRIMTYEDSVGLPYLYRKLLEVIVRQKKYSEAESYFILGIELGERFRQFQELPGIYAAKGALCYGEGKTDSALYYYKKAEQFNDKFPELGNQMNIYGGLSDTYRLIKNYKNADKYLQLHLDAKNKSDSAFYRARYMSTFAKYNYNIYQREIEYYKNQQILFISIISVVTVSFLFIGYLYIKVNRAGRKLVQKNIEVVEGHVSRESHQSFYPDKDSGGSSEIDEESISKIITDLEKLMTDKKLYLDSNISITKTADLLNTNRTYLSQAINQVHNVNFTMYINDLRIKEAIHLINSGEVQHLNIKGLAEKSGFNNRVTFANAFQRFTGVSPSFFIKNAEKY